MLPAVTMETEASHMLEAALEQMDDIIAGESYKKSPASLVTNTTFREIIDVGCILRIRHPTLVHYNRS